MNNMLGWTILCLWQDYMTCKGFLAFENHYWITDLGVWNISRCAHGYRIALGARPFIFFLSAGHLFSQHSPSVIANFVVFFVSWCFPQGKHGFLHGMMVFFASFVEEKADKELCSLLQFSRIKTYQTLFELPHRTAFHLPHLSTLGYGLSIQLLL